MSEDLEEIIMDDKREKVTGVRDYGYEADIDENRKVYGCLTDNGAAFKFTSHGIDTEVFLSWEAIDSMGAVIIQLLKDKQAKRITWKHEVAIPD